MITYYDDAPDSSRQAPITNSPTIASTTEDQPQTSNLHPCAPRHSSASTRLGLAAMSLENASTFAHTQMGSSRELMSSTGRFSTFSSFGCCCSSHALLSSARESLRALRNVSHKP